MCGGGGEAEDCGFVYWFPLPLPQATDPLQTQQVLEEAKLRMQEEMERRANAKEADAAMDQEKIR